MPLLINRVPTYRLHKQSGQAVVTLNGHDHLLGKHGSAASRKEYNRRIAEWTANDRQPVAACDLCVTELITRYRKHVEAYYRRVDGTATSEADNIRQALKPLRELYGHTLASAFGPLALEALRAQMVQLGWCRTNINRQIARVKQFFKWGVSKELVPADVYGALVTVRGLSEGRSKAVESDAIEPVADEVVDAALPHLSSVVSAMVQVQRLTGARPGEVCSMKIGEVNRSGEVWTYKPPLHKTRHKGHRRTIYIGPKAQAILTPFLMKLDPAAHVFSPRDAVEEMRQRRAAARKTPMSCGNRPGTNRHRRPGRVIGDSYDVATYRRAIARACDDAFPPPAEMVKPEEIRAWRTAHRFHPHQLRHSAATQIRAAFGIEAAQHALGHTTIDTTLLYAEKNAAVVERVAMAIG